MGVRTIVVCIATVACVGASSAVARRAGHPAASADARLVDPVEMPKRSMALRGPAIPADELLGTHAAYRLLVTLRRSAQPKSCRYKDIDFVLRLADRYLIAGVPIGRRLTISRTVRVNAWWYSHRASGTKRGLTLREPDGVLSTYWECRGFAVNPVATTGRWLNMNADVTTTQMARVLEPLGAIRRSGSRRFRVWEYYDIPERPGVIKPGTSGMAQGRIARIMAKAYRETGEVRFLNATIAAMETFTISVNRGGARSLVAFPVTSRPAPWFVERAFPGTNPWRGAALNGFMASILSLRATAGDLKVPPAGGASNPAALKARALADTLATQGSNTLLRYLPLHDSGAWSYYGMLPSGHPWRTYLAPLNYHCYHISLLRQLNLTFPGRGYDVWNAKWTGYVTRRGLRCMVS